MLVTVNCKREAYDVFMGRPGPYGNPFIIGRDGNRETVLKKYREYLYSNLDLQALLVKNLYGKSLRLGCFCSPKDCHVDIIIEFLKLYKEIENAE